MQSPSRFQNQLKTFLRILNEYPQDVQLAHFLPEFFRANRQMGSSDRRNASRLLYNYFRIGKACAELPPTERLSMALYLCSAEQDDMAMFLNEALHQPLDPEERRQDVIKRIYPSFNKSDIYPFTEYLSEDIDVNSFLDSFLVQPDLFIRLHPGKEKFAFGVLEQHQIEYKDLGDNCVALPNGTKLDQIFAAAAPTKPFEIQDYSSQKTAAYFNAQKHDYWWDACAASGGKSILLAHTSPEIKLLATDLRENILRNLDERFQQAGIRKYQRKVIDLNYSPQALLHGFSFDGIILDAPCTGSGTWGRTPELISQFNSRSILKFQSLQRRIAENVLPYLKLGKPLIYITCSAFKAENEDNVAYFQSALGLKLEAMEVLKGYERKADTMFVARFIKQEPPGL